MTWLLVMVLEILAAMAVGFVLGRIWQIRCALEQERVDDFTPPTIGRIRTSCATAAGGRCNYRPSAMPARRDPHNKARFEFFD